ncbi:hypothetical protein [Candidatus Nitronereus thalassa]|uniref:Uncharacterized protein n=1 Tax=Candidatus Nitronereus thalassa TaxID=3020898 RepID=A0ABU3K9C9_9BACT|nr:hypothetical protein [Candidatus Nitronereus thalassa]MDT7043017.1 hypothetical protein [Candidatus Nitronereus thalassa]
MDTIEDYLSKTESATIKLFEGIQSYINILKDAHSPAFAFYESEEEKIQKEYREWEKLNRGKIENAIAAQEKFVDESFALATLCGTVLQLAAMGIQKYSKNTDIIPEFKGIIKPGTKPVKFCVGRSERDLPIGLIIYAGRNQYNHLDGRNLNPINTAIFKKLSQIESFNNKGTFYTDQAFDLKNELIVNYSDNITALLGWRAYDSYLADMRSMLG